MTCYESQGVAVVRVNGEAVASATTTIRNGAADFVGDTAETQITAVRIDEVLIPLAHPEFAKWNALVGLTVSPEKLTEV